MHLNLPLRSYSVRTDWPISSNSNPISTLFATVAVVKPIAAIIDIALYLHHLRHNMNILTVNMYWQTAAWYSFFCIIMTGPVGTVLTL
jgi:hypothetical protein